MSRELYLPNKYSVIQGQGGVGFCTVWSDPDKVLKQAPDLLAYSALVGTLYSTEGVNPILRNLALNPDVRHLFVWGHGALSQTQYGRAGVNVLKSLWTNGCAPDHIVNGTRFKLHQEIDLPAIHAITQGVQLIDVSDRTLPDATAESALIPVMVEKYMSPVMFPDHKVDSSEPFPSEEVGFVVRGKYIVDAWVEVMDRVMRYGTIKETESGSNQRELIGVQWVIGKEDTKNPYFPDWPEELSQVTGCSRLAIERYYQEFMSAHLPEGTTYTYGQRLWAWGAENLDDRGVSQVGKIIEHLKASPVTRRAVATTWDQWIDSDKSTKNPPCFVMMQVIQTNGKLHMLATFRSHDIFKAGIPNAFGLRKLQEHIATEAGFEVGQLTITSNSAHVYEEDWDQAKKTLECAKWERKPRLSFDQAADSDPRGIVLVRLDNGRIVAELHSSERGILLTFEGKTARQVSRRLSLLGLLGTMDHAMYVAEELQKAEVAINLKISYIQDKALRLKFN